MSGRRACGKPSHPSAGLRARTALVDGEVVYLDAYGRPVGGLGERAFSALPEGAPEYLREAVAHLALRQLDETTTPGRRIDEGICVPRPVPATQGSPVASDSDRSAAILVRPGYLAPELAAVCLLLRREGRAALPVVIADARYLVGPLLRPRGRLCIFCVQRAIRPNMPRVPIDPFFIDPARIASLRRIARSHVQTYGDQLPYSLLEFDDRHRAIRLHHVRHFPDCALCGEASENALAPRRPSLKSRPHAGGGDTGARNDVPEAVFHRLRHLVSPITGAVRHVRRVDIGLPADFHVYTAGHASGIDPRSLDGMLQDARDRSGGKGSTAAQARTSAICEAIERFSAVQQGGDVDVAGFAADIDGAIEPGAVLRFSDRQYSDREAWNANCRGSFQRVPERFDPDTAISWSRVWSLLDGSERYVPSALIYAGARDPGERFCRADSNGLAAGGSFEEATLHALLELVERDAVAVWWYNRMRRRGIGTGSVADPYVRRVTRNYDDMGRDSWILDLTTDIAVPVFAAVSSRRQTPREIVFGFGAHLDPRIAIRRSVAEMNQLLTTAARPPDQRSAILRGGFADAAAWWQDPSPGVAEYLLPHGSPLVPEVAYPYDDPRDLLADLESTLARVADSGVEVFVRDLTRADLGLPVVKVIAPGLRHFWRRLGPGRLYDVPVKLGLRPRRCREAEMNPISVFV